MSICLILSPVAIIPEPETFSRNLNEVTIQQWSRQLAMITGDVNVETVGHSYGGCYAKCGCSQVKAKILGEQGKSTCFKLLPASIMEIGGRTDDIRSYSELFRMPASNNAPVSSPNHLSCFQD